jgi:hypothetical protein
MAKKVQQKPGTILGPVDYVLVRFPGNRFSGEIAPELANLERKGIIRIIDLVFVVKDKDGVVVIMKAEDLGGKAGDAFGEFARITSEWFSTGDIEEIAAELPKNTSYGILVFENTWAVPLKKACFDSGVELIDQDRIPQEAIRRLEAIRKVELDLISQGDV